MKSQLQLLTITASVAAFFSLTGSAVFGVGLRQSNNVSRTVLFAQTLHRESIQNLGTGLVFLIIAAAVVLLTRHRIREADAKYCALEREVAILRDRCSRAAAQA